LEFDFNLLAPMKFLLFIIFIFSYTLISAQKFKGDSWKTVTANKTGTVSLIYYEQPGLIYDGPDGKPKGACVDILKDFVDFVSKKYNIKITLSYAAKLNTFQEFIWTVQHGEGIVGVSNVTITEPRKKVMKFTNPYMRNPLVLISHKDAPSLKSLDELPTKFSSYHAEVVEGSTHVGVINKIKEEKMTTLTIKQSPSGIEILKKINTDKTLFTLVEITDYVDAIRNKYAVKHHNIKLTEDEFLGFIMPLSADWDDVFNEFLTEDYRKSPAYKKIIRDNLGVTFLGFLLE
jgi:ABC-type amino acid transport substrate-binding protein